MTRGWLVAIALVAIELTGAFGQIGVEPAGFDAIISDSLRGHLTYLASDELEGRGTPSHGLDLAAEYVAAQFRAANLEPAAPDGSYFQNARFLLGETLSANEAGAESGLTLTSGGRALEVSKDDVRIRALQPLDFDNVVVASAPAAGNIVAVDSMRSLESVRAARPALILVYGRFSRAPSTPMLDDAEQPRVPVVRIGSPEAIELLRSGRPVRLTLHAATPRVKEVTLRNVAAILPGSDAALRSQFIVLSAHYDHLGRTAAGIFNGANDDASGTASVIAIAAALARMTLRPRRSILFLAFFGEEEGLLGSTYYTRHPLVPLKGTVAEINLEQVGRTDDTTGPKIASFAFTGPDYTNLPAMMRDAARAEGVTVYNRPAADSFFSRSDNYAFAECGVADSTIAVAFDYPEYHKIGDTVDKIDFDNLARVDRAIARGVVHLAEEPSIPKWSDVPGARQFRQRTCGVALNAR